MGSAEITIFGYLALPRSLWLGVNDADNEISRLRTLYFVHAL
jgi:hypothetical protein